MDYLLRTQLVTTGLTIKAYQDAKSYSVYSLIVRLSKDMNQSFEPYPFLTNTTYTLFELCVSYDWRVLASNMFQTHITVSF